MPPARAPTSCTFPRGYQRAGAAARRDAPRLQADAGRFRGRHAHERARRRAPVSRRLSSAGLDRELLALLELVPAARPAPRRRRAFAHRRHHEAGDRALQRGYAPRVHRRALGRRRHGRDHGRDLPRPLRRRRHSFRPAIRVGARRGLPRLPRCAASARTLASLLPTVPTIVFHGDQDTTVRHHDGDYAIAGAQHKSEYRRGGRTRLHAHGLSHARRPPSSTGWCTAAATHGPAATRRLRTQTRAAPTRRARCCASFSTARYVQVFESSRW